MEGTRAQIASPAGPVAVSLPKSPLVAMKGSTIKSTPKERVVHTLEWNVKEYSASKLFGQPKVIISELVGSTKEKEFTAIIGPSGCGKTTFLECLSLRTTNFTGSVAVNGKPVTGDYYVQMGYVHQQELFFAHLTVREHLNFHAVNRNGRTTDHATCLQMVDEVMQETGLSKCANTLIGGGVFNITKGISGGERKRLAIATELLSMPSILLLDEPTSGLDSVMGDLICLLLGSMARERGRIVMATIHSPSTKMWAYFSNVLIFAGAGGQLAYHGTTEGAEKFFSSLGFVRAPGANPAEFFLSTISAQRLDDATGTLEHSEDYLTIAKAFKEQRAKDTDFKVLPVDNSHRHVSPNFNSRSSLLTQLWRNLVRCYIEVLRAHQVLLVLTLNATSLGLIYGFLYYNQVPESWRNTMCMTFGLLVTTDIVTVGHVALELPFDWSVFSREYYAGANTLLPYFIARSLADIPRLLAMSLTLVIPYFMSGYGTEFLSESFFKYYLACVTFIAGMASLAYLGSSFSPNPVIGVIIATVIGTPMVLFSGFMYERDAVPIYFKWLLDTSMINWSFSALMSDYCDGKMETFKCKTLTTFLQIKPNEYWTDMTYMLALVVGFRVLAYIIMSVRMAARK